MKKFWNWTQTDAGERELRIEGVILDEDWFDEGVTPAAFREELMQGEGDITVWINSPGGICTAAAEIYTMLMEYKGNVTVKIDALAASAATVIAMAGGTVEISPVAQMMIHNPWSMAVGDAAEMKRTAQMLETVKESIMNAYELKTGLPRDEISELMDAETYLDANEAVKYGFADSIMYADDDGEEMPAAACSQSAVMDEMFAAVKAKAMKKMTARAQTKPKAQEPPKSAPPKVDTRIPVNQLHRRLELIKH